MPLEPWEDHVLADDLTRADQRLFAAMRAQRMVQDPGPEDRRERAEAEAQDDAEMQAHGWWQGDMPELPPAGISGGGFVWTVVIFAVAALIALAIGALRADAAMPPPAQAALVIRDDPGGRVDVRFYQIKALKASGQKVELRGACYSSCTMFLALQDNVCVAANAQFGFHGPSFYGIPQGREWVEVWGEFIASYYPDPVARWYRDGVMRSQTIRRVSGAELIRLGVRECGQ